MSRPEGVTESDKSSPLMHYTHYTHTHMYIHAHCILNIREEEGKL